MHADGRVDKRIAIRQANARFEIRRPVAGADRQHRFDAGRERALDHGLAVVVELFAVQMAVGIDQLHDLLQPRADRHVFEEARQHRHVAFARCRDDHALRFDAPQLARRRLATITTLRPTSSSGL